MIRSARVLVWLWIIFIGFLVPACIYTQLSGRAPATRTPRETGMRLAENILTRQQFMMYQTPGVAALHYAEVCAAYGALKMARLTKDDVLFDKLVKRYDRVVEEGLPNTANHVDANVYGMLPLEVYMHTNDSAYLQQGLVLAEGQWANPLPGGLSPQTRFWIDDIYMIGCLQVQAYRATGDRKYLDRAAITAEAYIQKLQQPNGLFFHGSEAPFYWGRGNGWVAAGLAELLSELPADHLKYPTIAGGFSKMMQTLLKMQDTDGMWHQLIDRKDSFKETSSTAMFGFAMLVGVKKGLLPSRLYTRAYLKAWNGLGNYFTPEGEMREVCVGTGQSTDTSYYLNRPRTTGDFHGQAPMLWFACELIRHKIMPAGR